ncbi:MAG: selenobiotic family radical SAM modification target peptide [Desulfobulbaceae bacterium]|nr:selenobiotic family radical SAM modification target peptide [Desulfobulbaceae bacterium]
MEKKELRNLLAGLSLVALVGGAGLGVTGCAATGSGNGGTKPESAETNEVDEGTFTG